MEASMNAKKEAYEYVPRLKLYRVREKGLNEGKAIYGMVVDHDSFCARFNAESLQPNILMCRLRNSKKPAIKRVYEC